MPKYSPFVLVGFALLSTARPAAADPVTILTAARSILNSAHAGSNSTGTTVLSDENVLSNTIGVLLPSGEFGSLSSAFQSSVVTADMFSGNAAVGTSQNTTSVQTGAHAQASYYVAF